jgi:hypothetical protein
VLKVVKVRGRRAYVYPTTKGLVREAGEVAKAFARVRPTAVGLSLSDRELAEVRLALGHDAGPEGEGGAGPHDDGTKGAGEERHVGDVARDTADGGQEDDGRDPDADVGAEGGGVDVEGADDMLEMPGGMVGREDVEEAMEEPFAPDLMAADSAARGDRVFVSDTDMTYSRKLAAFGDVELPPPAFREAVARADAAGAEVACLDLDDDAYTEAFVEHVTYWQLLRHSRTIRGMRRMPASGPEALALEWDRRVRAIKGFAAVERARERAIAAGLLSLLARHQRVLVVLDLPLVEGVLAQLKRQAARAAPPSAPATAPALDPTGRRDGPM